MNLRERILFLLCDPDISDAEFDRVRNWIESGAIIQGVQDVRMIRDTLRAHRGRPARIKQHSASPEERDLVTEVDRLLRKEARIPARQALELLADKVNFDGELPERVSFAEGISKIGRLVGYSTLLSAAHQVRNEAVHQTGGSTWPLNRG